MPKLPTKLGCPLSIRQHYNSIINLFSINKIAKLDGIHVWKAQYKFEMPNYINGSILYTSNSSKSLYRDIKSFRANNNSELSFKLSSIEINH